MRNYLMLFLVAACFTSCVTERKARKFFDENPAAAAAYCDQKFPIVESSDTTVREDSATAKRTQDSLQRYADSLLAIARQKTEDYNREVAEGVDLVDRLVRESGALAREKDSISRALAALRKGLAPVNVERIRADIRKELEKQVKPCKDSIITRTVESTAKLALKDEEIRRMQAKLDKANWWKTFWFWAFLVAATAFGLIYIFFRRRSPDGTSVTIVNPPADSGIKTNSDAPY
jgi:hypothetical protein